MIKQEQNLLQNFFIDNLIYDFYCTVRTLPTKKSHRENDVFFFHT